MTVYCLFRITDIGCNELWEVFSSREAAEKFKIGRHRASFKIEVYTVR